MGCEKVKENWRIEKLSILFEEKKKNASSNYWEAGDWEEQAQMGTGAQWHIIASGSWLRLTP